MKRIVLSLIAIMMVVTLAGCGSKEVHVEGTLEEIMTKVYEKFPEENMINFVNVEITKENEVGFLGSDTIEYAEALASENMIGSIAHSVILLRTKEGADVEAVKEQIKKSINPRKWICVWVEDEDVIIENKGDLIIVIMVQDEENRSIIEEGFNNL